MPHHQALRLGCDAVRDGDVRPQPRERVARHGGVNHQPLARNGLDREDHRAEAARGGLSGGHGLGGHRLGSHGRGWVAGEEGHRWRWH